MDSQKKRFRFELMMFAILVGGWYLLAAMFFRRNEGVFYTPMGLILMNATGSDGTIRWGVLGSNIFAFFIPYCVYLAVRLVRFGIRSIRSLLGIGTTPADEVKEPEMKKLNAFDWIALILLVFNGLTRGVMGVMKMDPVMGTIAVILGMTGTRIFFVLIGLSAVYVAIRLPRLCRK